jgi:peptidoglycan hydrolase-like protein with peptidoglycan-binding domain
MTRLRWSIAAAWLAAGCIHARQVGQDQKGKPQPAGQQATSTPRVATEPGRPAVAASPSGLMNAGSARQIQEALHEKGYLHEVSGKLDEATSAALRRFQHDNDLAETGAPDRETLRHLGIDPSRVYRTVRK